MARVRPLTTSPQAFRLPQRRCSALVSAAALHPCTLSTPTPTHAGDPKLPLVAASGCGSMLYILGRAAAPTADVVGLSAARKGCPSEVRFFVSRPDMHTYMHASDHLLILTNMHMTGHTLHQPQHLLSPDPHSPVCRAPQALRPPEGRRSAATKRCRGGCCRGR